MKKRLPHSFFTLLCFFFLVGILALLHSCSGGRSRQKTAAADTPKAAVVPPFKLHVYLENSGSLQGYLNGQGDEYRNVVADLINELGFLKDDNDKLLCQETKLNFISTEILPVKEKAEGWANRLKATDFASPTSDMVEMLSMIIDQHKGNALSVFVSDCVFTSNSTSPTMQQTNLKMQFRKLVAKGDVSTLVYQVPCSFKGKYYPPKAKAMAYEGERPLYIWLIGNNATLAYFDRVCPFSQLQRVTRLQEMRAVAAAKEVNWKVNPSANKGEYALVKGTKGHAISDARMGKGSQKGFVLTLEANLASLPLSSAYLTEPAHYEISSKDYRLTIAENTQSGYTHRFTLTAIDENQCAVKKETVSLRLKRECPAWIVAAHEQTGLTPIEGKTYGIGDMLRGVIAAYDSNPDIFKLQFEIQ